MKAKLLIFACSIFININAQNINNEKDLPVGLWIDTITNYENYDTVILEGNYNIINLDSFEVIDSFGWDTYKVKYENSFPLLFIEKRVNNIASVRNGLWNYYDLTGRVLEISYWENGINLWWKSFGQNGQLITHYYKDVKNDTIFYDDYAKEKLIRRRYYPPDDKNNMIIIDY